ncbi:MAG: SsrA-binding protein SmpB [Alphaproteobacteria bacterium]|nr:SsrA-binding protein SmpB [Alphaproteobacteria bacterium]
MAAKQKKPVFGSPTIQNRRARFDYTITDEIEAGIVLLGTEVKSLRKGECNLNDSYAGEFKDEIWLYNCYIAEYSGGNQFNHETRRPRKLLLSRKEINKLMGRTKAKGITIVPLSMYFTKRGYAKVKLGLATGKKQHEKRDTIKDRDWQRQKARIMKDHG